MDFSKITDATLIAAAIAVFDTGLTELTKQVLTGVKEQRFLPLLPLVYGIGLAFLVASQYSWQADVLGGIICGLGSMGLYSGGKTVLGK